jgi:hypothetical protein
VRKAGSSGGISFPCVCIPHEQQMLNILRLHSQLFA